METDDKPFKSVDKDAAWLSKLPTAVAIIMASLLFAYVYIFHKLPLDGSPAAWGAFGDYIGGLLNPIISLFTLIVAVEVWSLQKKELLETRQAVMEQGKTAEQQRREQRFFDLLNIYQETLKTFVVEGTTGKAALNNWANLSPNGQTCFDFTLRGLDEYAHDVLEKNPTTGRMTRQTRIERMSRSRVEVEWQHFSPIFDHYFRTVFAILGELETLLGNDHWRYGKLFRAQFSRDELTLMAFNLLFDSEGKKMRSLVCKYGLLKHLSNNKLRDQALVELDARAFGRGWGKAQNPSSKIEDGHAS